MIHPHCEFNLFLPEGESMAVERCNECGKTTAKGEEEQRKLSMEHPIFGTDFSKPLSESIEKLRRQLSQIRGELSDISYAYPGYKQDLDSVEGLLTCGIRSLHSTKEQMKAHEKEDPK